MSYRALLATGLAGWAATAAAQEIDSRPARDPIAVRRAAGAITVDGDLSDPGWQGVEAIDTWYETNPGNNVPPKVGNVGYLAYDDDFLYAAFEFADPEPQRIQAPLGDRDSISGNTDDYGGLIIDSNNDGKTALLLLANPRGIQYDAFSSDAYGEDAAPDFYWESAGRVTETGWALEMRVPFSSLRYTESDPEQWGIMLYRNRPREFRYQMFTTRLPRDSNCFICNVQPLVGLAGLPGGSHWVAAPYLHANQLSQPRAGLGTPLESDDPQAELGADVKWIPNPDTVLDATVNPDFSQVESDEAQIAANERFALFFPEKRPFFLEGIDLFSTPIQAHYTRTFTAPRWGARATGEVAGTAYTAMVGEDRGGGSVILPGANSSQLAFQDFESLVAVARVRRDIGRSFASFLYSGREIDESDGGGANRVFGPDFRWQPNDQDEVTGQLLYSFSDTPRRPDLVAEWDGRRLEGHAARLSWYRQTDTWDYYTRLQDVDKEFRADNGFVPQVGYRYGQAEVGYTLRPEDRPVSRLRLSGTVEYVGGRDGGILTRGLTPRLEMNAVRNSFIGVELAFEDVLGIDEVHKRVQVRPSFELSPGRIWARALLSATLGDEVDFVNDRLGDGVTVGLTNIFRPTDHLQFEVLTDRRWLDVETPEGRSGRLFTADVARLKTVYTFNARSWIRLIGQWVETERDPALYRVDVSAEDSDFAGSAVFAYKLNWQTVLYAGYGDTRLLDPRTGDIEPADRQVFLKISYAFQG
ncbi:MAG: DUF5916 domain-containing protein [Thermoanaerobaculia bacterium]